MTTPPTAAESPYRGANASPEAASQVESKQHKDSLAGVFDSMVQANLRSLVSARRTFFVNTVCVVLTTAAALSTATDLYYNRQETRELIASLRANCPPVKN